MALVLISTVIVSSLVVVVSDEDAEVNVPLVHCRDSTGQGASWLCEA